jgi:hypothetical protein
MLRGPYRKKQKRKSNEIPETLHPTREAGSAAFLKLTPSRVIPSMQITCAKGMFSDANNVTLKPGKKWAIIIANAAQPFDQSDIKICDDHNTQGFLFHAEIDLITGLRRAPLFP